MLHSAAHNDHIGRQEACRVCVCALKLISSWCCSGAARVTSHWRYVTKWLPGGFCHDMMNASGSSALDSSRAIFFSTLPVFGYSLSWRRRENPGGKPAGDPRREISTVRSRRRRALASPPRRSVPRAILYLQQDQKKKKKSKTLPVCYWFKYFPKLQAQETVVVLAARPARRQKSFQRNIGLKNDRRKRETG